MRRCNNDHPNLETVKAISRRYAAVARFMDYTQVRTVPVVVHAMYNDYRRSDITYMMQTLNRNMRNRDQDHIPDAKSQTLAVLRRRALFRGSNNKARTWRAYLRRARDTFIRFELARVFPSAQLDINIAGNRDTITSQSIKPYGFKNMRTLHIWLVRATDNILGMAAFPWDNNLKNDGVIVDYRTIHPRFGFTPYHLNKTLVHEVGHWLGLLHTFQKTDVTLRPVDLNNNGILDEGEATGDFVFDTPRLDSPTRGNPFMSRDFPMSGSIVAQFNNYMDYSDDIAYTMFTIDQRKRMHYFFYTYRT
jgi:hypothetical protein